jgi:molybdopterin molybdotransferase
MAQLADDCFAFGGPLMTVGAALELIAARVPPLDGVEQAALVEAAGRVLARDLVASFDQPPHDNVAVDGYAFAHADLAPGEPTRLAIAGRHAAGDAPASLPPRGAARVFTGAVLPAGADTVAMQEDVRVDGAHVVVPPGLKRGANRRKAGEDIKIGQTALAAGQRLRPQDLALAAALGVDRVAVYRRLRVALFSTGDELVAPGGALRPGAVYDANRTLLHTLLLELGCAVTDLGILPDRAEPVRAALAAAAPGHDLLLTSGGVSTGEEDHLKAAVEALGKLHLWRLAIKPGRPVAIGQIGDASFVGLPGNPVAVMVCFLKIARPLILRRAGARELSPPLYRVRAGFDFAKKADRREWVRARLVRGADGEPVAERFPRQGSGVISSLVESDGLVELPEALTRLEAGAMVDFLPFGEAHA